MFARKTSDCERRYSLNVLGVEDRGDTNNEILNEFTENITRKKDGSHLRSMHTRRRPAWNNPSNHIAEGNEYRDVCDKTKGWNAGVSPHSGEWKRFMHLHLFADASTLACCSVAIAVVERDMGVVNNPCKVWKVFVQGQENSGDNRRSKHYLRKLPTKINLADLRSTQERNHR